MGVLLSLCSGNLHLTDTVLMTYCRPTFSLIKGNGSDSAIGPVRLENLDKTYHRLVNTNNIANLVGYTGIHNLPCFRVFHVCTTDPSNQIIQ